MRTRKLLVGLIGAFTLVLALFVPVTSAEAAFGKPTSVDARAISGSNGMTVTWRAPTGGTPAAYRVSFGTSSSSSKASAIYVTGTSATLSNLSTKKYYYVWVTPWSEAKSLGTATGAISSSDRAKTSSFRYSAPTTIKAVNATKTSMEIVWRTVTGSPGYVLRAVGGGTTRYQYGFDGSTVFAGLKPGTSYKFTVANRLPVTNNTDLPGVRMSNYSSKSSTKSTNPTAVRLPDNTVSRMYDAPTDLKSTATDHESVTLSWTPPVGYNASIHKFRVYWAEDQEMTDNDSYRDLASVGGQVHGLGSNTNYFIRVRMITHTKLANGTWVATAVSDRTQGIMVKTRSPKGFISGTVTGAAGTVLTDYVAAAYSSAGDVNAQVNVNSSGNYKLELRPGYYFIQIAYVGSGNYTTQWVDTAGQLAYTREEAKVITVKLGSTPTSAEPVAIREGGILKGTVKSVSGAVVRDVFVAARTEWTSAREVVSQDTTDTSGVFELRGLPPGKTVFLRINGSAVGYGAKSSGVEAVPASGGTRTVSTLVIPA